MSRIVELDRGMETLGGHDQGGLEGKFTDLILLRVVMGSDHLFMVIGGSMPGWNCQTPAATVFILVKSWTYIE